MPLYNFMHTRVMVIETIAMKLKGISWGSRETSDDSEGLIFWGILLSCTQSLRFVIF